MMKASALQALFLSLAAVLLIVVPDQILPGRSPADSLGDAVHDFFQFAKGDSTDSASSRRGAFVLLLQRVGTLAALAGMGIGGYAWYRRRDRILAAAAVLVGLLAVLLLQARLGVMLALALIVYLVYDRLRP